MPENGILGNRFEKRRVLQKLAGLPAGQNRGQVEAKSVDVHLGHPVAQAVEDEVAHHRMVTVEGVPDAGEVRVMGAVLFEEVVDRVVDSAK